jgi:hypothetical protein
MGVAVAATRGMASAGLTAGPHIAMVAAGVFEDGVDSLGVPGLLRARDSGNMSPTREAAATTRRRPLVARDRLPAHDGPPPSSSPASAPGPRVREERRTNRAVVGVWLAAICQALEALHFGVQDVDMLGDALAALSWLVPGRPYPGRDRTGSGRPCRAAPRAAEPFLLTFARYSNIRSQNREWATGRGRSVPGRASSGPSR